MANVQSAKLILMNAAAENSVILPAVNITRKEKIIRVKKNNSIRHICFDLDGTLVNSYTTIYKTTLKTLEHLNILDPLEEREFYKRIGHHFLNIFQDLKIDVPDVEHFINIYKNFYFDFIDDSTLYNGVENVLRELNINEIKISLLTTKGQDQAERIIEHFNLQKYFSFIMGRRIGMPIKPSGEPLEIICREVNVSPADTLMIGDSELDIRCGKNAAAETCGVTYGYRSIDELKKENPDYLISDPEEILSIIKF